MIIAGAGGHGLELLALLKEQNLTANPIYFYDENDLLLDVIESIPVIKSKTELKSILNTYPDFFLGVGNPVFRERLDQNLTELGGVLTSVSSSNAVNQSNSVNADVFSFGFIGPKVQLGRGVLINTRANVHHECKIGDYCEIGPGAIILGNASLGKKCRIGAGAVILPGISLGDHVIVGAGAVVTKNIMDNTKVIGVPAKTLNR